MENLIQDIISIFTNTDGVELVRLSGLTKRARRITDFTELPDDAVDSILHKLKDNGIISWEYITRCPYCNEKSYILKPLGVDMKICDSCKTIYPLIVGSTVEQDSLKV